MRRLTVVLCILFLFLFSVGIGWAESGLPARPESEQQAPFKAGQILVAFQPALQAAGDPRPTPTPTISPCLIESAHPYLNNTDQTWALHNPNAGAAFSRIHFMRIELGELLRCNRGGLEQRRQCHPEPSLPSCLRAVEPQPVPGGTVKVRLRSDFSVQEWGFCVDAVEHPPAQTPTPTPAITPTVTPTVQPSDCLAESPHPYANNYGRTWNLLNPNQTAAYSRVHFARLQTESCCGPRSYCADPAGGGSGPRYSGSYPAQLCWRSRLSPGAQVDVRFTADGSVTDWGSYRCHRDG